MKIEQAYCLCVDKRIKFTKFMKQQFRELDIPLHLFIAGQGNLLPEKRYDHIDTNDVAPTWSYGNGQARINNYNIFLCHQQMIQHAKDHRWNNVLLLEDDAIILPRFKALIPQVLAQLDQMNWDACYLGHHHPDKDQYEAEYQNSGTVQVRYTNHMGGWHGVLLNHTAYDPLLSVPPKQNMDVTCPRACWSCFSIPRLILYRNVPSNALEENPDARFYDYEYDLLEGLEYE